MFPDIVENGKHHDSDKDNHTNNLCAFEYFFRNFPACDQFPGGKYHVSSVKSGDRQNIHKCQHHGNQPGDQPETVPVPYAAINFHDADRPLQGLAGAFLPGEDFSQSADIGPQICHSVFVAVFDSGKKTVSFGFIRMFADHANQAC